MTYGLFGTMTAAPGRGEDLVAHLLRAADQVRAFPDCLLYLIATTERPDEVAVTEMWRTREAHDASLTDPGVQALIAEVRPILAGFGEQMVLDVRGGLGAPAS